MVNTKKKKICIVATSLSVGGAERSSANLSKMLCDLGHEIHLVTVLSGIDYDYRGKLFDLGAIKQANDTKMGRVKRLLTFKKYLRKHDFDIIIDNRSRVQAYREFIVSKLIYRWPTIYVIHNFNQDKVFTKYKRLNQWLYKNEQMVTVSRASEEKFRILYGLNCITTIYNGFDYDRIQTLAKEDIDLKLPNDYILFYGRIDDHHKNLKLLLKAYKSSDLPSSDIALVILGDGPDLNMLKTLVTQLDLNDSVMLKGFTKNPYPYVKNAKFTVLTSRFEGFPMVIPESLSLSVPVVSVDCQSGPNEVIVTGENGILVQNHDAQKLAEAFGKMISNDQLYNTCVANAESSVKAFSLKEVMQSWEQLIQTVSK